MINLGKSEMAELNIQYLPSFIAHDCVVVFQAGILCIKLIWVLFQVPVFMPKAELKKENSREIYRGEVFKTHLNTLM